MSAVVRISTPFVDEVLLVEALKSIEAFSCVDSNESIYTNRRDALGVQAFDRSPRGHYVFKYDSDSDSIGLGPTKKPVQQFINRVEKAYLEANKKYLERLAEEERIRIELERKKRVDYIRTEAIKNAKAQGYAVRETHNGEQIQLILTRTVY